MNRSIGSFARLQQLNAFGFGVDGSDLKLDLVYNPGGAFLPPDQGALQAAVWGGRRVFY